MLKLLQFTPPWKIRREFKRLWQQLIGVVQPIWEKRDLRLHDHWFDNQVNVHQGHQQKNSFHRSQKEFKSSMNLPMHTPLHANSIQLQRGGFD